MCVSALRLFHISNIETRKHPLKRKEIPTFERRRTRRTREVRVPVEPRPSRMVGKASTPAFLERPPQVLPNVSWVHPATAGVQSALMEGDAATAQSLLKELLTCAKGMPAPWGVDAAAHAWVPSRGTPGFSGVREPLNARPLPPAQTCETHRATHLYTPDEKERAQLLMVMIDAERKRRVRSPSRHQRCASEWGGVGFGKRAHLPSLPQVQQRDRVRSQGAAARCCRGGKGDSHCSPRGWQRVCARRGRGARKDVQKESGVQLAGTRPHRAHLSCPPAPDAVGAV